MKKNKAATRIQRAPAIFSKVNIKIRKTNKLLELPIEFIHANTKRVQV